MKIDYKNLNIRESARCTRERRLLIGDSALVTVCLNITLKRPAGIIANHPRVQYKGGESSDTSCFIENWSKLYQKDKFSIFSMMIAQLWTYLNLMMIAKSMFWIVKEIKFKIGVRALK